MGAGDIQPLALAKPIFECFERSPLVPGRIDLPVADHLGQRRDRRVRVRIPDSLLLLTRPTARRPFLPRWDFAIVQPLHRGAYRVPESTPPSRPGGDGVGDGLAAAA